MHTFARITLIFLLLSPFCGFKSFSNEINYLAPESTVSSQKIPVNEWETLSQKHQLYAPGELQKRIRSIRKLVPFVLDKVSSLLDLNKEKVVAIYATGDYILSPSLGKGSVISTPQELDFIAFVSDPDQEKFSTKTTRIEIEPKQIFDKDELGYDSAYSVNIKIASSAEKRSIAKAEAYYLGCLIHGEHPWIKAPESQMIIRLIRNLFDDISLSGVNALVLLKKLSPIMLLMKEKLTPSVMTRLDERDLGVTQEIKGFISKIYPDMNFVPTGQQVEEYI